MSAIRKLHYKFRKLFLIEQRNREFNEFKEIKEIKEFREFREFKEFSDDSLNSLYSLNSLKLKKKPSQVGRLYIKGDLSKYYFDM